MKKITITLILVVAMMATVLCTSVSAYISADAEYFAETLLEIYGWYGEEGMTEADKAQWDNYIAKYGMTDEQSDAIFAASSHDEGLVGNFRTRVYTDEEKAKLQNFANEIANILGLTVGYSTGTVTFYKDGEVALSFSGISAITENGSTTTSTDVTPSTEEPTVTEPAVETEVGAEANAETTTTTETEAEETSATQVSEPVKDSTPKTGSLNLEAVLAIVSLASLVGMVVASKKN